MLTRKSIIILIALALSFSSPVLAASGSGGHSAGISSLGWYFFNFCIYCAVLFYFVRKPAAKAWKERCRTIAMHVNSAQTQLDDAKARLLHAQTEAAALSERIKFLQGEINKSTEQERFRMVEATAEQAAAIAKQADLLIEAERQAQFQNVERSVSSLVLEKAEQLLRAEFQLSDDLQYKARLSENLKSLRIS